MKYQWEKGAQPIALEDVTEAVLADHGEKLVRIETGGHGCWWRKGKDGGKDEGYTSRDDAGTWKLSWAYTQTRHLGPHTSYGNPWEKMIRFHPAIFESRRDQEAFDTATEFPVTLIQYRVLTGISEAYTPDCISVDGEDQDLLWDDDLGHGWRDPEGEYIALTDDELISHGLALASWETHSVVAFRSETVSPTADREGTWQALSEATFRAEALASIDDRKGTWRAFTVSASGMLADMISFQRTHG